MHLKVNQAVSLEDNLGRMNLMVTQRVSTWWLPRAYALRGHSVGMHLKFTQVVGYKITQYVCSPRLCSMYALEGHSVCKHLNSFRKYALEDHPVRMLWNSFRTSKVLHLLTPSPPNFWYRSLSEFCLDLSTSSKSSIHCREQHLAIRSKKLGISHGYLLSS